MSGDPDRRWEDGEYVRPQRPGRYLSPDQDAHLRPMDYHVAQAHLDAHRTKEVIIVHLQAMHGLAGGPSDIDGLREMHAKDHRVVPPGLRGGVDAVTEQIKAEHLKAGLRVRLVKARGVDLEGEPVLVVKTAKLIDSRMVPLARYVQLEFEDGTRFDVEAWAIFELVSLIVHAMRSEDPDEPIEVWCDAEGATVENTSNLVDQVTCEACKTALDNAPSLTIPVDTSGFRDQDIIDGARGVGLKAHFPGAEDYDQIAVQFAETAWRRGLISTQRRDWLVETKPKVEALVRDIPDRGHHAPGISYFQLAESCIAQQEADHPLVENGSILGETRRVPRGRSMADVEMIVGEAIEEWAACAFAPERPAAMPTLARYIADKLMEGEDD